MHGRHGALQCTWCRKRDLKPMPTMTGSLDFCPLSFKAWHSAVPLLSSTHQHAWTATIHANSLHKDYVHQLRVEHPPT
jgi:hypothetical protein